MAKAVKENESIGTLAKNPLMISIIAILYEEDRELPQRRVKLYETATDLLLRRLDKQRQIKNKYKKNQKEFILKKLALDNHIHQNRILTEKTVLAMIRRHAAQIGLEEKETKQFLEEIWQRSNLLRQVAREEYEFLHLSFQEYFTALELKNRPDGMDTIIENIDNPWWEESVLLFAGLSQDAAPLIRRIQEEVPEDRYNIHLILAGKCIADAEFTDPTVKDDVVDRLWDIYQRREFLHIWDEAMFVLSLIKPYRLVSSLIENLSSSDIDTRRRAAEALRGIGSVDAVPALILSLKKNSDSYVRFSAALALGRIGGTEAMLALIDALKGDKDAYVRRRAADALKGVGSAEAVPALVKVLQTDNVIDVRWSAALALGGIGSIEAVPALIKTLRTDNDAYVRGSIAEALCEIGSTKAVKPLIEAMKTDKEAYVRWRAASALGNIGDDSAVPELIKALKNKDGYGNRKIEDDLLEALSKFNKHYLPDDSRPGS